MPATPITLKVSTVYVAFSPELGLVSYGGCRDEALNNLQDALRERKRPTDQGTGYENK